MEEVLTLGEEAARENARRERRASRERIQASIAAFERAIPTIDERIAVLQANLATLHQLSEIAGTLPANVQGSQSLLLFRGTESRQSLNDVRGTLTDLLAGTETAQQVRLDVLIGERAKAATQLEGLRVGLQEFSETVNV